MLVALARHFAKPANKPQRTLVFVASAGHHTPGINGPRSFVAANPDLAKQAVMLVNIEHVAQRNFSPARTTASDGYREAVADSGEAPIAVGVTNNSPFLQELIDGGPARFGVNFISERSTFQSGETGGWASLNVAKVSVMQAPPLYHTTGEVLDVISAPGPRAHRPVPGLVCGVGRSRSTRAHQPVSRADPRGRRAFVREFVTTVQAGKKAGKTPDQVAKEWATPASYKGYLPAPALERVKAYVELIYSETK